MHQSSHLTLSIQLDTAVVHVWNDANVIHVRYGSHDPSQIMGATPDGVHIAVTTGDDGALMFRAARGVTTSTELYWVRSGDHGIVLTDNFRRALALVPAGERRMTGDHLASHLLFRTVPGDRTYLDSVHRLGHGEQIEWTRDSGTITRRITEKLDCAAPRIDTSSTEWLDHVSTALGDALASLNGLPGNSVANLLSGGVDSTLLHTYLPGIESVHGVIDSPAFRPEIDYAMAASTMLGSKHHAVPTHEADFLTALESVIGALAMPPHHMQTVLFDAAYTSGHSTYVTAQLADAVFGLPPSSVAARAESIRRITRVRAAARVLQSARGIGKVRTALRLADELNRGPANPDSFANTFARYSSREVVSSILGAEAYERALNERLAYVANRTKGIDFDEPGLGSNLEVGHVVDFFTDDAVSIWRQLGIQRGVSLIAPFTHPQVVAASLLRASPGRYVEDGIAKPALKQLLETRLPQYPVRQVKLASGLPFDTYYTTGPLSTVWERYAVPEWIPTAMLDANGWPRLEVAWNAITHAIWKDAVVSAALLIDEPGRRVDVPLYRVTT